MSTGAKVKEWWEGEQARQFLCVPVAFALGIGLYFALPSEPNAYLFPALAALSVGLAVMFWRWAKPLLIGLSLVILGAMWADLSAARHQPIMLREALSPRPIVGVVSDIERTEHGVRLTLEQLQISDVEAALTPTRIRISVKLKKDSTLALPHIGDGIGMMAGLMPPMGPALPHGFDFARYFFFRGIGAVGYGMPPWEIITPDVAPTVETRFRNWRQNLTEEIIGRLGVGTGGIAAGLITGDARAITEEDFNALRASNLYHIIAISGEHMVVIAGVIFISLRLLALLLPTRFGLRPQVKSIAAAITLLLITAYLCVTGMPISAVRAYVMILLVLLAVMLRRQVDAMRSLSIAALLMLIYDPSDLFEPGFQLSFAATIAIIALVETTLLRSTALEQASWWGRARSVLFTMFMISVVAEAATMPLVISQFNNVSIYGVLANMLATPLVSLFLMPTVALFFILLPLGLEHLALGLMKYGIQALLALGYWVAGLPHAQQFAPSIPGYGIAIFALGLLWMCIWQSRSRRYGAVAMVLGVATIMLNYSPDMLVGAQLKQIALRGPNGFVLARGRANSMIPELWANGLGYAELPEPDSDQWRCDKLGCVARMGKQLVAFPSDALALREDCTQAQMIFTSFRDVSCDGKVDVWDAGRLAGRNVVALWFEGERVRTETSADWQGNRPWTAKVEPLNVVDGD